MTDVPRIPDRIPHPQSPIAPLYAVVDTEAAARAGWSPVDLADAYLDGGARLLQLRAKPDASGAFFDLACAIVERTRARGALLVVNDRADIARASGADGVHVGQDDLPPAGARRIVGSEAIVGLSTHTPGQIASALDAPITYLAIGPVFQTATKRTGYGAVGLDGVARAAQAAARRGVPIVAIGGITLERAADVIAAGAASVAVIGDLVASGDPAARVRAYLGRIGEAPKV